MFGIKQSGNSQRLAEPEWEKFTALKACGCGSSGYKPCSWENQELLLQSCAPTCLTTKIQSFPFCREASHSGVRKHTRQNSVSQMVDTSVLVHSTGNQGLILGCGSTSLRGHWESQDVGTLASSYALLPPTLARDASPHPFHLSRGSLKPVIKTAARACWEQLSLWDTSVSLRHLTEPSI